MFTIMLAVCLAVLALLLLVAGVAPKRTAMSLFELERRKGKGDHAATLILRREALLIRVLSLQRVLTSLLLVLLVVVLITTLGWFFGIITSVVVALEYNALARLGLIQHVGETIYNRHEEAILRFVEKYPRVFRAIQAAFPSSNPNPHLDSKEELEHLVANGGAVLSKQEQKHILNGLKFDKRQVNEIMTPRGMIDSIEKKEHLGPLVLSDLHETGHSRFPVIDGDTDHVVGVLHIQDLLVIDSGKKSSSVEKAMEPRVFYIREDQTLAHALAAFIRTRHHLFIVINEFRETVGVVSLEDVMEALLGHKIVDEFDTHEDLRVVAARNPRKINDPDKREDV